MLSAKNHKIIAAIRDEERVYPASLTKLMTLYLTFEAIESGKLFPGKILTISARGEEVSNVNKVNTLHLKEGDKITVREAIRAIIVKSFNEAALTLAEEVSGDEWHFVRKMNEAARKLKMTNTSFRNSTGLHEEGQYTTVYDLARLTFAIREKFPGYYRLFALKEFEFNGVKYETHNNVLLDYNGAEGLKTGFTNASGYNLISAAYNKNSQQRIISIVVGCPSAQLRNDFVKSFFDEGFKKIAMSYEGRTALQLSSY